MPFTRKILLIEDDSTLRAAIVRGLTAKRFKVLETASASAAIALARAELPNLVLCDLNLAPSGNAFEILESLRVTAETAAIPFVLMSGDPLPEHAFHGGNAPDAGLEKPFTFAELLSIVEKFVPPAEAQ